MSENKDKTMRDLLNEAAPVARKSLTMEEAAKIRNSMLRLRELKRQILVTKETDAEKRLITDYLNKAAIQHFNELMGCWFAVMMEYQPLLNMVLAIMNRAQQMQQMEQPAAETPPPQV